jgi:hypothetical protein
MAAVPPLVGEFQFLRKTSFFLEIDSFCPGWVSVSLETSRVWPEKLTWSLP